MLIILTSLTIKQKFFWILFVLTRPGRMISIKSSNNQRLEKCVRCVLLLYNWDLRGQVCQSVQDGGQSLKWSSISERYPRDIVKPAGVKNDENECVLSNATKEWLLSRHLWIRSIAFINYFSKIIRQMKENAVYLLLDRDRFSWYALIFPTSQSKRASDNT